MVESTDPCAIGFPESRRSSASFHVPSRFWTSLWPQAHSWRPMCQSWTESGVFLLLFARHSRVDEEPPRAFVMVDRSSLRFADAVLPSS